jgi:hypothetical protein
MIIRWLRKLLGREPLPKAAEAMEAGLAEPQSYEVYYDDEGNSCINVKGVKHLEIVNVSTISRVYLK